MKHLSNSEVLCWREEGDRTAELSVIGSTCRRLDFLLGKTNLRDLMVVVKAGKVTRRSLHASYNTWESFDRKCHEATEVREAFLNFLQFSNLTTRLR